MPDNHGPSRQRVEAALQQVSDLGVEATRIFISIDRERARRDADEIDARVTAGESLPLAGKVCSIKDLVDRSGERTTAGSRLLERRSNADEDADILVRLEAAGVVILGRTNLTEFAYSGVGLNPHHGTPGCVFDKTLIPGGSSSGAALSVAHGVCDLAIGTDTGGSVRIPAAVNGLYGIKPTSRSVPTTGIHPLNALMDSVGPLSASWPEARLALEVLRGSPIEHSAPAPIRLGLPTGALTTGLDASVTAVFESTVDTLRQAGVELIDVDCAWLADLAESNRTLIACEALEQYGPDIKELRLVGDPHVLERMRFAEEVDAATRATAVATREASVTRFGEALADAGVSAILSPTVAIETPTIAEANANFATVNASMLRNASLINFVDGCAVSLPTVSTGALPGALMVSAASGQDQTLINLVDALVPMLN